MLKNLKIRLLKFQIRLLLGGYHLSLNPKGGGRKKKHNLGDTISEEYRNSHLQGNFPGRNLGD